MAQYELCLIIDYFCFKRSFVFLKSHTLNFNWHSKKYNLYLSVIYGSSLIGKISRVMESFIRGFFFFIRKYVIL